MLLLCGTWAEKCTSLVRKASGMLFAGLPWPPVSRRPVLALILLCRLLLLVQQVEWQSRLITLVLRLTVLDLCRLSTTGAFPPPFVWPLGLWPSRVNMRTGSPSLPVRSPRLLETLVTLCLWSPRVRPARECTSRRQLTLTV